METKTAIRQEVREKLQQMSRTAYFKRSTNIARQLWQRDIWQQAACIGVTKAIFPEVDTVPLIERAWKEGKKVALPRIDMRVKMMTFYEVTVWTQLEETRYRLLEPIVSECPRIEHEKIDLMIVPGVAFTRTGERLGLGGGFYDRLLPSYTGTTVSLCFAEQVRQSLPTEAHDERIDWVLVEGDG